MTNAIEHLESSIQQSCDIIAPEVEVQLIDQQNEDQHLQIRQEEEPVDLD